MVIYHSILSIMKGILFKIIVFSQSGFEGGQLFIDARDKELNNKTSNAIGSLIVGMTCILNGVYKSLP